jgi:hypothetical protein
MKPRDYVGRTVTLTQITALREDARTEERARIAARLSNHYLAQIVCDPVAKSDNPVCSCSLIHLGWHPSIGAAVAAWVDHAVSS